MMTNMFDINFSLLLLLLLGKCVFILLFLDKYVNLTSPQHNHAVISVSFQEQFVQFVSCLCSSVVTHTAGQVRGG